MPVTSVPTLSYQPSQKRCPACGTTYDGAMLFCPADGKGLIGIGPDGGLAGRMIDERYLVKDRIGQGGMGSVWRAEQVRVGRPAALKIIRPDASDDPQLVARFRREALSACRINHPNVVATYDFGETPDGMFYIAMELVEGGSLAALLASGGALPPERAGYIARQIGDALSAAEDVGVVHRDLKPENVMLGRRKDGTDLVKVVDFGIAKANWRRGQTAVTMTGIIVGTPGYVSPEQLVGEKELDGRSDQYTLGLITYEMLAGKRVHAARNFGDAMRRLTEQAPRLSQLRPDIDWPPELQATLDRALDTEPENRFPSAAEFGYVVAEQIAAWRGVAVGPRYRVALPKRAGSGAAGSGAAESGKAESKVAGSSATRTPASSGAAVSASAAPASIGPGTAIPGRLIAAAIGVALVGAIGGALLVQLAR